MTICHGNLNPNNILISFPMGSRIGPMMKVSGFGHWKIIPATPNILFRVHGHEDWTPAEAKTQYRPTVQVDIFSLGCIFAYTLSGGRHPFGENCFTSNSIKQKIAYRIEMSRQPTHLTGKEVKEPEALNLIRAMLSVEPMQRPAALAVLNDPYFINNSSNNP
jgi:serine/threonine protein kinase